MKQFIKEKKWKVQNWTIWLAGTWTGNLLEDTFLKTSILSEMKGFTKSKWEISSTTMAQSTVTSTVQNTFVFMMLLFPYRNVFYPSSLCKELNIGSNAFRRQFGFSREAQVVRRETLLWLWLEMKFRGDSEETNKRSWNWTNKQLRKFWCVLPMSSLFTSFVNRERPPRASIAFLWLLRPIFGDRFTKIQWPERSGWQSWKLSIATVGESASSRVQFQLRVCQLPECELVNHWAIERFLKHSRECQLLLWDVTDDF